MGVIVKKKDPEDLANGIIEVINNKEKYVKERAEILSVVGTKTCLSVFEKCFKESGF